MYSMFNIILFIVFISKYMNCSFNHQLRPELRSVCIGNGEFLMLMTSSDEFPGYVVSQLATAVAIPLPSTIDYNWGGVLSFANQLQ